MLSLPPWANQSLYKQVGLNYTPVPGGVGPMTINTLIYQAVEAAEKKLS